MTFASIRRFVIRYERHLSVFGMAVGFLLDNAALKEINGLPETLLLTFYFFATGLLIIAVHLAEVREYPRLKRARPWLLLALQVVIGSWYSAFLVFYSHSASFSATWPFLVILFFLFAGTEIFKSYQDRLAYQNALYFFAIFTYATALVPLVLGSVGTLAFLVSGAVSAALFTGFFWLLYVLGAARLRAARLRVVSAVAVVFAIINIFYFAHLLPPLPLTLRDIGVYHSVTKSGDAYAAKGEPSGFLARFFGDEAVHVVKGDPVFVFSSVYTPITVKTTLIHRWERYDETQKKWVAASLVEYGVQGGRDEGYRGYSELPRIPAGQWRVSVETPNGALIGRIGFRVEYAAEEPALVQSTL
jgi:hypothetical protein